MRKYATRSRSGFKLVLLGLIYSLFSSGISAWTSPSQFLCPRPSSNPTVARREKQVCSNQHLKRTPGQSSYLVARGEPKFVSSMDSVQSKPNETIRVQGKKWNKHKTDQRSIKHTFQKAKQLERQGKWVEACIQYEQILQRAPHDAHSHLGLARLEARRERKFRSWESDKEPKDLVSVFAPTRAEVAFARGTAACPESVHLWQAWAIYEESRGNTNRARELFEEALRLEPRNPYVCHAYGLMEKKLGNPDNAVRLFEQSLEENSTAALVCSLGEILIADKHLERARVLYAEKLPHLKSEKDKIEVYLASAWLEERHFKNYGRAQELLHQALHINPESSLANVALARLEGRMQRSSGKNATWGSGATAKRLAKACKQIEGGNHNQKNTDGRVFNTLASLEVKNRRYAVAREVLKRGISIYPNDHTLYQAAGRVEERFGNFTAARAFYGESLRLKPSAPTLVAFAMLELRHPESQKTNYTFVKGLFEEALLLDPRHGPAYNAYGTFECRRGNIDEARAIFERGAKADCNDAASLYHGYGKFELSLGNVDEARSILEKGITAVKTRVLGMDSTLMDRTTFLSHTLGMLELNSNRPVVALEIFLDGIVRCGNSSQLLLGAALCEMRLGREEAARAFFEKSVLSDKQHAQAWHAWGVMETRAGSFKTAATLFQCGIRSTPNHGPLWHGYASLEAIKGNVKNARILFAGGLKKAPYYCPLYQGWALLELGEGNHMAARKLISESLTKNKANGSGWLIAAEIEMKMGNDGLVGLLLRRGIECAPDDAELYNKLGTVLVERSEFAKAREVFEKGMELNPLYAPLYHSLAELEARVCNLDGLAKLNKRAASFFNNNALVPAPSSSEVYGKRIKAKLSRNLPSGVAALAEKIVDDDIDGIDGTLLGVDDINDVDPMSALESMNANVMEDEFIESLIDISR